MQTHEIATAARPLQVAAWVDVCYRRREQSVDPMGCLLSASRGNSWSHHAPISRGV